MILANVLGTGPINAKYLLAKRGNSDESRERYRSKRKPTLQDINVTRKVKQLQFFFFFLLKCTYERQVFFLA